MGIGRVAHRRQQIWLALTLLTFLSMGAAQAQEAPVEVVHLAEKSLPGFFNRIPPGAMEDYGFATGDSLAQAYLARPFRVHTIKPAELLSAPTGKSIRGMLSETKMWYFPVMIKDEARAILVVDQVNGQWQAVSLGYANLARSLGTAMQRWPGTKGFNPLLIAMFQAKEYLLLVPEENPDLLFGLGGPDRGLRMENAARVMERLKPVIEENLRQGR